MCPDGKTHRKIWKTFLPATILLCTALCLVGWWYFSLWVLVGYILHRLGLENDLDLIGISGSEALWIKSVVFIPLVAMSTFYARAIQGFGGHRSFWSHGPFFSTFIRLMFFSAPFVLLFRYYFLDSLVIEFAGMFVGLSIADNYHTFFDWVTGELNFWGRAGAHSDFLNWLMKRTFDYPSDETLRKRRNRRGWKSGINDEF